MERKVLGRGLDALISPEQFNEEKKDIIPLNPEEIIPNRYQPRIEFNEDKFNELVNSIKEKGLIQPIVVRLTQDGRYELIAGERRLRAVRLLGYKEIPAIIKEVTDRELLELSIIENVQRADLNPIEEAKAYESLIKEFNFTQEQIAKSVGKDRTTIANMLRLLSLPEQVKDALLKKLITFGHAKIILSLAEPAQQGALLDEIIKRSFSVRATENYVNISGSKKKVTKNIPDRDPHICQIEEQLQHALGTKVKIFHGGKRGKIQIEYYSLDDLDRILTILNQKPV